MTWRKLSEVINNMKTEDLDNDVVLVVSEAYGGGRMFPVAMEATGSIYSVKWLDGNPVDNKRKILVRKGKPYLYG